MSQNITENEAPSPLIARTEQINSVDGQLASLGYTSVFDIARIPREHFLKKHRCELGRDTGKIYDLAIGYAHQIARSFRKNRLSRAVSRNFRGAFSVNGPDYSSQFPDEVWTGLSPVGAPEANDGVARYATALYQLALDREGDTGGNSRLMNTLAKRRPDLSTLMVDDKAISEEIPQLQVVTDVLSAAIQATAPDSLSNLSAVNEKLSTSRFPNAFPFDFGNVQIQASQGEINTSLQALVDTLTPDMPAAWLSPASPAKGIFTDLKRLQVMASGLGPEQQRIITETDDSLKGDDGAGLPAFYANNFGSADLTAASFASMGALTACTGLTVPEVGKMLSVNAGGQQVISSPNCGNLVTGASMYGSVYILGLNKAVITIKKDDVTGALSLSPVPGDVQLMHINRMVRLQRWLELPYEDVDLLLTSYLHAAGENMTTCPLSDGTLRTLGLFRHYQHRYGTTAKQFAAWLHLVTPYAITPATSFFDQIFNADSTFDTPFQADNTVFSYRATDGADGLRGKQIMAALGLNQRQFLLLAGQVAEHQNGGDAAKGTLTCHLGTATAFYRIASLAKTLALGVDEFCALADMLDAESGAVWKQLAGSPTISQLADGDAPADDILCLLQALSWLTGWQKQAKLPVATTALLCAPLPPTTGTEAQLSFIQQIWQRLPATFVNAGMLARSGAPLKEDIDDEHHAGIDWFALLGAAGLIDIAGLVTDAFTPDAVADVVNQQHLAGDGKAAAITALSAALKQAQGTQHGIAMTGLAQALNVSQSLPALLLRWAGVTPYQWLQETWGMSPDAPVGEYLPPEGRIGATTTEKEYNLLAADWRDAKWNPVNGELTLTLRLSFNLRDTGSRKDISDNWLNLPTGLTVNGTPTLTSGNWPDGCKGNPDYKGTGVVWRPTGNDSSKKYFMVNTLYTMEVPLKGTFSAVSELAALANRPFKFGMHRWSSTSGDLNAAWPLMKTTVTTADTLPVVWLATLRDIARRGMACSQVQLSPAGLQAMLDNPQWFSMNLPETAKNITLQILYRLSRYVALLTLLGDAGYAEDDLLAYLRDMHATPPLTDDIAAATLATLLSWEASEATAAFADGALGHAAATLDDLDVVMNLRQSTQASGMTVEALAQGFALSRDDGYAAWSRTGQAMVAGVRHLANR